MFCGDTIGKYRLVRKLGRGGMGEVWLATASGHGGFTKTVVIKTLLPEYACDPLFIEMLANEARICAKLSHPNLIEVFDFTEHGGLYLLAMEYVMGRPLHHVMRAARLRELAVPAWFALRVAWECCRGLEYAHAQGVIHCDLSPSNVMVTFTGLTKILDFGVAHSMARGTKAARLEGKFSYIAPERVKSLATDCRTDIYSLGVMLYLVFTGQLPFTADTDMELLQKIVKTRPRPPSQLAPVDPRIERLILRAMQPDPAKRHQTVAEVLAEMEPCLEGQLGAYGQHDVASFIGDLFEVPDPEAAMREMPPIPPPPRHAESAGADSDVSTRNPRSEQSASVVELDAEDSSLLLEIPVENPAVPVLPGPAAAGYRVARGSAWSPPLDRQDAKPVESLSRMFAHAPEIIEDARTTVQSLFGERHTAGAFGPSKIFDRPDTVEPVHAAARAPEPDPDPEPAALPAPPEREAEPGARPGGFGSYSILRPRGGVLWPWASSRTKSH